MGMSAHVVGYRPVDEKWKQMKQVWDACTAAKVKIPDEVDKFFNGGKPDSCGVEVPLTGCVAEWSDHDYRDGFELDLSKLPKDVTVIRFYNSW